jgi:hypothetical protein
MKLADKINVFNESLELRAKLPPGIRAMNPFREPGSPVPAMAGAFYNKYYGDNLPRNLILAINPGRLGAGATGIPFTDTRRLQEVCGITAGIPPTHEPSSVFVYEMIAAYGGPEAFYGDFYIASVCPLGFVRMNDRGQEVNYNYYDARELQDAVTPFITEKLRQQLDFGLRRETAVCWGKGKNYSFLEKLNQKHGFFGRILVLEHPRFIMQYRARQKQSYMARYLDTFREALAR